MGKQASDSNDNSNNELYLQERKLLFNAKLEQSRLFDKAIITLTAGVFGLSIAFYKHFIPNNKAQAVCFLITAWICFSLSLISTLVSFLVSESTIDRYVEALDNPESNTNTFAAVSFGLAIASIILFF